MNRKGQALIEFVLILPVVIMLLFVIVDFGLIFSNKTSLENKSYDIVESIKNNEYDSTIYNDIDVNISIEDDYKHITITKNVKIFNFGLDKVLKNPYKIEIERYIPNE